MRRNTLAVDAGIAVVLAILVIVISPGLAVVGLIALLVVVMCAVSLGIDRLRNRRRSDPMRELRRSRAAQSGSTRQRAATSSRGRAGASTAPRRPRPRRH